MIETSDKFPLYIKFPDKSDFPRTIFSLFFFQQKKIILIFYKPVMSFLSFD